MRRFSKTWVVDVHDHTRQSFVSIVDQKPEDRSLDISDNCALRRRFLHLSIPHQVCQRRRDLCEYSDMDVEFGMFFANDEGEVAIVVHTIDLLDLY